MCRTPPQHRGPLIVSRLIEEPGAAEQGPGVDGVESRDHAFAVDVAMIKKAIRAAGFVQVAQDIVPGHRNAVIIVEKPLQVRQQPAQQFVVPGVQKMSLQPDGPHEGIIGHVQKHIAGTDRIHLPGFELNPGEFLQGLGRQPVRAEDMIPRPGLNHRIGDILRLILRGRIQIVNLERTGQGTFAGFPNAIELVVRGGKGTGIVEFALPHHHAGTANFDSGGGTARQQEHIPQAPRLHRQPGAFPGAENHGLGATTPLQDSG